MTMGILLLLLHLVKRSFICYDTTRASGQDGISAQMLKATAAVITPSVIKLFTAKPKLLFLANYI